MQQELIAQPHKQDKPDKLDALAWPTLPKAPKRQLSSPGNIGASWRAWGWAGENAARQRSGPDAFPVNDECFRLECARCGFQKLLNF